MSRSFFFFKQKTAYEMRISDWSSDVCSSDHTSVTRLEAERSGRTDLGKMIRDLPQNFAGGQNPTIAGGGQGGFTNVSGSSTLNLRGLGPDASLTLINGHRVAFDAVLQGIDISAIPLEEIGRASCRERVCQYV